MNTRGLGKVRPILLWNALALAVLIAYFGWRWLRAAEYDHLAEHLGHTGAPRTFPIAYFRERVPAGAGPQEVWSRVRGYTEVRYYLVPLAGTADSVVVQQFRYPMRWDRLDVEVEYRGGVVSDVDVSGEERLGRAITPGEAHTRLKWTPPDQSAEKWNR
jgi:hypothetical protein